MLVQPKRMDKGGCQKIPSAKKSGSLEGRNELGDEVQRCLFVFACLHDIQLRLHEIKTSGLSRSWQRRKIKMSPFLKNEFQLGFATSYEFLLLRISDWSIDQDNFNKKASECDEDQITEKFFSQIKINQLRIRRYG